MSLAKQMLEMLSLKTRELVDAEIKKGERDIAGLRKPVSLKPGYYWAKWRIPADGTHEGELICPMDTWEIVQVNANRLDWDVDPDGESLSVHVPGVRETQWPDCFVWGEFVCPLEKPA